MDWNSERLVPPECSVFIGLESVTDPDEWGAGSSENDDTYRKWTQHIRSYHRWFGMHSRECAKCDDEIRSGEPYIGRIYAEALAKPVRNWKGRMVYSRLWTEYEHWMCPRDMDDAEAFHRQMEAAREAERAEKAERQRQAA